jgi:hypothetical protein
MVKKTKDKTQIIQEEFYDYIGRINSLRDIVDERDRRYEQRFQSQEKAVQVALVTQEKYDERQNSLSDRVTAQQQYFITKQEFEGRHTELVNQIAALREFKASISGDSKFDEMYREIENLREAKSKIEGASSGIKQSWGVVAAINIAVLGFIGLAITFVEVFIIGK